jgi:hypothetical protein
MPPTRKTLLVWLALAAPALAQDASGDLDPSHSELRPFLERYARPDEALS